MSVDRREIIAKQSQFYKIGFRRLINFSLFLSIIVILLLGIIFYQIFSRPEMQYFVTTTDGRLIELNPIK